jgi:DNA-binding MarR family transcriptional regulator
VSNIDLPRFANSVANDDTLSQRGKSDPRPGSTAPTSMPRERLDPSVYEGLAGFRHALRRFLAFSEAITEAAGVTPQQYQAMLVIKTYPDKEIMIRALAEQMLLVPNGAVQLVDRLVSADLVERRQSQIDRRSVLVALTPKGAILLERLAADHVEELLKREPLLAESLGRLRRMGLGQ